MRTFHAFRTHHEQSDKLRENVFTTTDPLDSPSHLTLTHTIRTIRLLPTHHTLRRKAPAVLQDDNNDIRREGEGWRQQLRQRLKSGQARAHPLTKPAHDNNILDTAARSQRTIRVIQQQDCLLNSEPRGQICASNKRLPLTERPSLTIPKPAKSLARLLPLSFTAGAHPTSPKLPHAYPQARDPTESAARFDRLHHTAPLPHRDAAIANHTLAARRPHSHRSGRRPPPPLCLLQQTLCPRSRRLDARNRG